MAEAVLKNILKEKGLEGIEVSSAGIHALVGEEAPAAAQRVLSRKGIHLSGHRGRQLDRDLVDQADILLVMDRYQLAVVESLLPESKGKLLLLREFAPQGGSEMVSDPYGGSEEDYRLCLSRIEECMPGLLERIGSHTFNAEGEGGGR
jgi:protein-tyrosine phosphatase